MQALASTAVAGGHSDHERDRVVGTVDYAANGFAPKDIATDFNFGEVTTSADRASHPENQLEDPSAINSELEIAPGVFFPAWTYDGRIPGPTIRASRATRSAFGSSMGAATHTRCIFTASTRPAWTACPAPARSIRARRFTYEFEATPFGCHLYHCHRLPLKRHIHKGLYGAFIVDPDPDAAPRGAATLPGPAAGHAGERALAGIRDGDERLRHQFRRRERGLRRQLDRLRLPASSRSASSAARPVRIYLVNITEFDPINSFHLHANFFDYYDHGTTLDADAAHHRHDHAVPGAARHSRVQVRRPRARSSTCSTPTRPSSPNWAGWACSRWFDLRFVWLLVPLSRSWPCCFTLFMLIRSTTGRRRAAGEGLAVERVRPSPGH